MAPCGWYRPSLIWAVMLGETESMPDWCLSNPLVGWLLASHTAGCRPSVCVMTALWKNHYCRGLTSVVIKLHHSAEKGVCPTWLTSKEERLWVWHYISICTLVRWIIRFKVKKNNLEDGEEKERQRKKKEIKKQTSFFLFCSRCEGVSSHGCVSAKHFSQACDLDIVFSTLWKNALCLTTCQE